MTQADLEILKHMMNGATPPDFAIRLLEDTCARTKLDWKARHVYLQKRANRRTNTDSWQAVLSIDGFRAVGSRHPQYAGQDGPEWTITPPPDHVWYDNPPDGNPYSARCGIKKKLDNGVVTTTWGVAKFKDYYAGSLWDKIPSTMNAKCAEMLAWRKTFPETFGGLYGDAEMAQAGFEDPDKTENPKRALQDAEVIAEAEVPTEPTNFQMWWNKLEGAQDLATVLAYGKEIQKDRTLGADAFRLHDLYTKLKKKYT